MSQVIVLGWLIVAGLTAVAAHAKNRSAFEGFLVGIFFPVLGMVIYRQNRRHPEAWTFGPSSQRSRKAF